MAPRERSPEGTRAQNSLANARRSSALVLGAVALAACSGATSEAPLPHETQGDSGVDARVVEAAVGPLAQGAGATNVAAAGRAAGAPGVGASAAVTPTAEGGRAIDWRTDPLPPGVQRIVDETGAITLRRVIEPCPTNPALTPLRGDAPPYRCETCNVGAECDLGLECVKGKVVSCFEGRAVCDRDGFLPVGRACGTGGRTCDGMGMCQCPMGQTACGGVCRANIGQRCTTGLGVCAREGTFVCNGSDVVCSAIAAMPMVEVCDGLDNNCNGVIDEVAGATCMVNSCMRGLLSCSGGMGACGPDTPVNEGMACPELVGGRCVSGVCTCPAGTYACGARCETVASCWSAGVGACRRPGTFACSAMGPACNAVMGTPSAETCNAIDDDCNGVTDDVPLPIMGIGLHASFVHWMGTPPDKFMAWPDATEVWSRIDPGPAVLPIPPSMVPSNVATIASDYMALSPDGKVNVDNFAVAWRGFLIVPATGSYTFQTEVEDGVYLTLNNVPVIDRWADAAMPTTDTSPPVPLTQGALVPIEMRMYNSAGPARAFLRWSGPGLPAGFSPIGSQFLLPARSNMVSRPFSNGFIAAYFQSGASIFPNILRFEPAPTVGADALVQNVTNVHPTGPTVGPTGYRVLWRGVLQAPRTGSTQIRAITNGNVTIRVNGTTIAPNTAGTATGMFAATAGTLYMLEVEMFTPTNNHTIELQWQLPMGAFARIPSANVFAVPAAPPPCTLGVPNPCVISTTLCSPTVAPTCYPLAFSAAGVACEIAAGVSGTCNGAGACVP